MGHDIELVPDPFKQGPSEEILVWSQKNNTAAVTHNKVAKRIKSKIRKRNIKKSRNVDIKQANMETYRETGWRRAKE